MYTSSFEGSDKIKASNNFSALSSLFSKIKISISNKAKFDESGCCSKPNLIAFLAKLILPFSK